MTVQTVDTNPPKRGLSLLDALDQSFMPSESTSSPEPSSNIADTPLRRNLLQTPNLKDYFDAVPGSSQKGMALEALRAARRIQDAGRSTADNDVEFLASALASSSRMVGAAPEFRLNYDQETPVRAIDVGGPDQEQRLADFVTKSIENTANSLTVKDSMKKLGLKNNRDLLPGVEVRLLNHQAIGVAWMLEKEKGHDRGGILADDMGLGKTVQMIATMAMNMPSLDDDCRTTLIVVPAALLQQWKDEIDTKTNGLFEVHVHHGKDKLKKISQLKSMDVVITSYQTLCQDFNVPKGTAPEDESEYIAEHGGLLSKAKFYRVIADEAQFIRNRSTRSSISLALVKAKFRWMLTGTPVTNTYIYGLLRFGRFRPWNDWNDFNEHVAKVQYEDAPLAGSRAQAILKPILLRRTKDSTLEGQPLLQLPLKHIEIVKLKFTPEEREVYDVFEKRTKIQLNRFMRNNTLIKNHAAVLVMILRLRQVCCHPYLILSLAEEFEDPTIRAKKVMGAAWAAEIKKKFLLRKASVELVDFEDESDEPEATCPNCRDLLLGDNGRVLACGHEMCFDCILELSNSAIAHNGIFGYGTEKENLAAEKEYEAAVAKGHRPCPSCKKMMDLKGDKTFKSSAFEPSDDELNDYLRSKRREKSRRYAQKTPERERSPSPVESIPDTLDSDSDDLPEVGDMFVAPQVKKGKKKAKASQDDYDVEMIDLTQSHVSSSSNKRLMKRKVIEDSDSDLEVLGGNSISQAKRSRNNSTSPVIAITKGKDERTMGMKARRTRSSQPGDGEWEASGDKTICYSQWTSMLDLIERLFSRHGIRSLRFDGKMDRAARDSTLAQFKQLNGPKVILISTKCGSVGLNLVSANRIVNMDLSWNYAAEAQAYDRCHRIGQEKEVYVKRLVVEDTIEDRMLRLQDVKVGLAEAALGEGTGAKLHKLSVKDIRYLFGMNKDPNARPEGQQSP
ncbi:SNF2 family N-terminal domain-containing protein [Flammula alnicola]|nr:SNF2 family N-terminal domain-containing protein [Flammula alnicola]